MVQRRYPRQRALTQCRPRDEYEIGTNQEDQGFTAVSVPATGRDRHEMYTRGNGQGGGADPPGGLVVGEVPGRRGGTAGRDEHNASGRLWSFGRSRPPAETVGAKRRPPAETVGAKRRPSPELRYLAIASGPAGRRQRDG